MSCNILLIITAFLHLSILAASWLLKYLVLPLYQRLDVKDFSLFYANIRAVMWFFGLIPLLTSNLLAFLLVFFHPESAPIELIYLVAICSFITFFIVLKYELPSHNTLFTLGKNDKLIECLIKNNAVRIKCLTVTSLALMYMIFKML
jgi:hypothetical protein